jgi:hypothetical protein
MKKLLFVPLALAVVVVNGQSLSRKAVFSKGQQLERVASVNMSFGMEMMGQTIDMKNVNTITTLVEVKNATDKDVALASTVKHVVMSMNGMGQEMAYDSDKKDGNTAPAEMTQKMGEMVGKTNNLTINSKGIITNSDDTTGGVAAANAGGFMGMGGGLVNVGNKPGNSYDLVANLPDKSLKAGDTWMDSTLSKEGKTVTSYKVLEIKGDEAVVSMDGTVAQNMETEQQGMTINMHINGTSKGQYTLEVATGIVKKRNATIDATGTMEVAGQSVPFTMKLIMDEGVVKK